MAFKKTQGRSVFVSPTGMPNLSGFKQAAQVYDNVSKLGFEIGTDIRSQDFNDLILQAEADGRSAGAMYDDDNNLVPLTNLDVSQAIENQAFSDNEKEALKLAYKKAAIQTYAVSVSNDAEVFANNIFSNNPDNPDAIRGGLEGYLEGLGADDELLSYIKPSIVHEFVTVENKAQANKVIRARKEKEESNLLHVARLHSKIATIMAKGAGNNPSVAAGMQKMVDELQGSIDESYEALRTVGYNDTDIKKLREQGAQVIAAKQSEAHIERFYYGSGLSYSQSLSEIMSIKKEFDEQEGIDANAVAQSMLNQLNLIDKVTKTQATEANKASSELTSSVMLDIITGKKVGLDDIALLDVSDGQKYQLVNVLMGYNQSQRTAKQQLRNEIDGNKIHQVHQEDPNENRQR